MTETKTTPADLDVTPRDIRFDFADAQKGPSVLSGEALPEAPKKKKGFSLFGGR